MGQPCLVGPEGRGTKAVSGCWRRFSSSADPRTSARGASGLQVWWGPRVQGACLGPEVRASALGFPSRAQPTSLLAREQGLALPLTLSVGRSHGSTRWWK